MAARIDHTGHPHPSTPAARAACRANGGTGSTAKPGTKAKASRPVAKAPVPKAPDITAPKVPVPTIKKAPFTNTVINVDTGKRISREEAAREMFGTKVTVTTVKTARKSGIGAKLGQTDDDRARIARNKADQEARLARIAARQGSTPGLTRAEAIDQIPVTTKDQIKANVRRVLKVQQGVVGDKISRIKGVDSKLPAPGTAEANAWGITANTLAVCMQSGHIHLHEDLHTREESLKNSVRSGWFSRVGDSTVDGTIAHEMGHAFLNPLRLTPADRLRIVDVLKEEFELTNPYGSPQWMSAGMLDEIITHRKNKEKIKRGVSKYAASNAAEFMAEVWAEYTMNPKPRPRVKRVGDVLKSIIESGRD